MLEVLNLGRSQQVTSVLPLQKTICMSIGATSSPQDLLFVQNCSDFLLPANESILQTGFISSVGHISLIYAYLLCVVQVLR